MSECSHDCSSCSANCGSRTQEKTDFLEPLYRESKVKKVIGIVSGKGGVGKSMTTSLLGVAAMRKGLHTAILDAMSQDHPSRRHLDFMKDYQVMQKELFFQQ